MPSIHVCPLSRLHDTVQSTGCTHLVSLLSDDTGLVRPDTISDERHLLLLMNDIAVAQDGLVLPEETHIQRYLAFLDQWDQTSPLLVHCWAGVSRSTAGLFIALCYFNPDCPEDRIAKALRRASPSATPNSRLVALADACLQRDGRMSAAIQAIGRGADAFEGTPFAMPVACNDVRDHPR